MLMGASRHGQLPSGGSEGRVDGRHHLVARVFASGASATGSMVHPVICQSNQRPKGSTEMPKTISAATLPQLHITEQHEKVLRELGVQLEREIVSMYEAFRFQVNRSVDDKRWKHVRTNDDVHAFVERKSALKRDLQLARSSSYDSNKPVPGTETCPQATLATDSQLRRVLVTGLLAGSLDDIMLGSSFQDTAGFQASWASQGGVMEESAVLAKIEGATMEDPYRFLGVTWFLRTFGLPNAILKRRDGLLWTDIHLAKLRNGERIGISIAHSIQHRDLGELHEFGTIRATSSVLRVFRQYDSRRVEVFMTQFLDTKGCESWSLKEAVNYMVPSAGYFMDGGFRKKLHWMVRYRTCRRAKTETHSQWIEPSSSGSNDHCEICDRTVGALFSCPGTSCHLCLKRVCSRCCVPHELPQKASSTKKSSGKTVDFCVDCILQAKALSTVDVAREELKRRCRVEDSSTSSRATSRSDSSSSSSSSSGSISSRSSSASSSSEPRRRALTMLVPNDEYS